MGPALRTGRPRPASAAPDFSGGGGLTRERSVGATKVAPAPVLRARMGSLQRTREAALNDRYGDNLGGFGDDPSGYFTPSAGGGGAGGVLSENNGQEQQQQRRAVVAGPGGRVRARPQSAAATMETGTGPGAGVAGGFGGGGSEGSQLGAGLPVRRQPGPLRGLFGEVEAPSQTFGAAWGVPDPSEMGLL